MRRGSFQQTLQVLPIPTLNPRRCLLVDPGQKRRTADGQGLILDKNQSIVKQ
jgi:hypothetical protein